MPQHVLVSSFATLIAAGVILSDDHFAAERDWSDTAALWRRVYAHEG